MIYAKERHFKKGDITRLHWHDYIELEYITNGEVINILNGKKYVCTKGSAYIVTRLDRHTVYSSNDSSIFTIMIPIELLHIKTRGILETKGQDFVFNLNKTEQTEMLNLLYFADNEVNNQKILSDVSGVNAIEQCIVYLLRKSNNSINMNAITKIKKIIDYINKNYTAQITVASIAEKFYYSPNYLGTLFYKNFGCSINTYINILRIKTACSLLLENNLSIKEVGVYCGYSSPQLFANTFKAYMETSPGEYRKLQENLYL